MTRPFWTQTQQPEPDDCDSIDTLLSLYADGMASPDETRRVEDHLPGCAACRQSLLWMQATQRALSSRPVMLPPADLRARIAQSIAAASTTPVPIRPTRVFALRPAFAAAASLTLLGAVVGYSLLHPHPTNIKPASPVEVASNSHTQPLAPSVTPLTQPSVRPIHPRPPLVKHIPSVDQHIADNNIGTPDDQLPIPVATPAVPTVSHAKPARKPVNAAMPPVKMHPRSLLRKKPILAVSGTVMARLPKSQPAENNAPTLKTPILKPFGAEVATSNVPPVSPMNPAPATLVSPEPTAVRVASAPTDPLGGLVRNQVAKMRSAAYSTTRIGIREASYVTHTATEESGTVNITSGPLP